MLTNELRVIARLIERFLDVKYLPTIPAFGSVLTFQCEYWDRNLRDILQDFLSDYGVYLLRCDFKDNLLYVVLEATLEYNTRELYGGNVIIYPKLITAAYDVEYVLDLIDDILRVISIKDFTLSVHYHAIMITVSDENLDTLLTSLRSIDIGTLLVSESYGSSVVEILFDDGQFVTIGVS